jgi:hypothetical protein
MLQRARGKVRQAREALKADAEGNVDRAAGHGGLSSDLLELAAVTEAVELTHGGTGSENKKKTELATPKQPGPPNASAATPTAVAAAAGGPAFPTLGVTLSFLERFTKEKVHGQPSRYCIAREDCDASSPDELSLKAGEILGIGDLGTFNNGWLVGYRRAGDWGDRLRFRAKAVQRLPGLSTDEVCGNIIKPETKAASWAADAVERSYAQVGAAACPFLRPVAAVWRHRCDWSVLCHEREERTAGSVDGARGGRHRSGHCQHLRQPRVDLRL